MKRKFDTDEQQGTHVAENIDDLQSQNKKRKLSSAEQQKAPISNPQATIEQNSKTNPNPLGTGLSDDACVAIKKKLDGSLKAKKEGLILKFFEIDNFSTEQMKKYKFCEAIEQFLASATNISDNLKAKAKEFIEKWSQPLESPKTQDLQPIKPETESPSSPMKKESTPVIQTPKKEKKQASVDNLLELAVNHNANEKDSEKLEEKNAVNTPGSPSPATPTPKSPFPINNEEIQAAVNKIKDSLKNKYPGESKRNFCVSSMATEFYKALKKDDNQFGVTVEFAIKTCVEIEKGLYEQCSKSTNDNYANQFKSIKFNLTDPHNPDFRGKVVSGEVKASSIPSMNAEDMASDAKKKERADAIQARIDERKPLFLKGAASKMFRCGKCKSGKISFYEKQTRSADEPMTAFCTCDDCGNKWRQG